MTMEYQILPICALIFLSFLSFHFLSKIFPRKKPNLPPGPKPWPVIGNLNLIGPLPHRSLHHLSLKYGPIMQLKLGSFPVVVASSVDAAKIFLKTMDLNFASRPKTSAGKYTTYNYSDILWSSYGPYFRQARKICSTELFSPKRLDSYEYIRAEERNSMLKAVLESAGNPMRLKDFLSTVSSNVICRMVMGKKYLDGGNVLSPEEFKTMMDELFLLNGVLNIGDFIPYIHFLDLQGYVKRMKAVSKKFDGFLEHVVAEHEARRRETAAEEYVSKDMVDVLLELAAEPNLEVKLQRDGVKAFTLDMLAGATESSATTVEWVMSEILKKPEVLKKATDELDRVIGRERWVEESDMSSLPYIEALMKETMRLHPVSPILVPRLAREDCQVSGYDMKKGTQVLINIWTIHMDPSIWENPAEFNPERFIGKDIDIKGQDFRLLPFGSGRRMCPGYALGLKVIQSTLANLLHGFKWKLANNMKPEELNMEEVFGLSAPRKFPLVAVVDPRLSLHLYNF
ncbi:trimethyltridecatetraene synthase-like [Salvia miltiorrhiza]|uniref:trimethyltridecatetraene synthase-like n=1 Tax=Salvia miltiorrhiza TaxID=226208 RepID=UPI0025ABEF90|nr:trimethyltridecatetraene synthase-like [Salvia miltiorrhiza]